MTVRLVDVFEPNNAAEADAIKQLLEEANILADVVSFGDTAFDGLFQAQKGWGRIRVKDTDSKKAKEIIQEWISAPWEEKTD